MTTRRAEQAALEKAEFCLRLNIAPSEYDALTDIEIQAFITIHNQIIDERNP